MSHINYENISLEKLAAIVSKKLNEHHIDSILVGGSCVSIYSQNRYQSYDLDYVTYEDLKKISKALNELGFEQNGRYFCHPKCEFYVEFVSPPVAIGEEPIHKFEFHHTPLGTIKMLTPTDSVKDRLASYYHWNDKQGLDQAISVCKEIFSRIDLQEIKRWSKNEGNTKEFEVFLQELRNHSLI